MKDYVILTDSCCDLGEEKRLELRVEYIPLLIAYEDKEFYATLNWDTFSPKEFYDMMRNGVQFKSSQVNNDTYYERFERYILEGYDVLSLSTSSGLSGSINSSYIAQKEILEKYPDAKVICVDCLRGSLGQGLMVEKASRLRDSGATIEEAAAWVENNRQNVHQMGTVEDLVYLKRAGRVTGAAAVMGDIFRIKPLLGSNTLGQNVSYAKAVGRKASIRKCVSYVKEHIINPEEQTVFVVHADCITDAERIKELLIEDVKVKDVYINYVGATIGASVGPGMVGIYFIGDEVTK